MTIKYVKQRFPPSPYDEEVKEMEYFRLLYNGDHEQIFSRARSLYDSDTVKKGYRTGKRLARYKLAQEANNNANTMYRYIVVNFTSLIAEVPADLVNRALGNISADSEEKKDTEFVEEVVKRSKIHDKIWAAVVQHQVDGRIVYRIRRDDNGTWFELKPGDMYLEHDDGLGADLAWIEERQEDDKTQKYLRVERQRLENGLKVDQLAFLVDGNTVKEELDISKFDETISSFTAQYEGIDELMIGYIPNEDLLTHPRGRSALRNVDDMQDEVNWTITRDSIVFEKHGKPKLAIPRRLYEGVVGDNQRKFGERFVRAADLEVVAYDENNGAIPMYITWDAALERSMEHVTRLIKYMMSISKTSLQAVGLEGAEGARSGVALLYELFQSVIKAESISAKFDNGIKEAIRKCIKLDNHISNGDLTEKDPVVEWKDFLPKAQSEVDDEETKKYEARVQSLETTIRKLHPDWSEEAIQTEIEKIQEEEEQQNIPPVSRTPNADLSRFGDDR
jgi:hypothetical protein